MDTYSDDEFDTNETDAEQAPNFRRALEKKASKAETEATAAKAEAEAAKRELALVRAGIDPESKQGKWFAKGYDGPLDSAAVKAAAIEAGLIESDEPTAPVEELAAHDRLSQAAAVNGNSVDEGSHLVQQAQQASNMDELMNLLRANGLEPEYEQPLGWTRSDSTSPM